MPSTEEIQEANFETRRVLEAEARRQRTIHYSELTPKIESLDLEPDSDRLKELLDGISRESNAVKGVMLSAVVIRKGEEPLPGPGFFKLARELGRTVGSDLQDRLAFHAEELKAVYAAYAR